MTDDENANPISEQLKRAVEELDLERRLQSAAAAAEDAVFRGVGLAGQFVHDHRADIEGFLDRATSAVDGQTGGRYADQVGKVREQLSAGVASLADRRWTPVPDDAAELDPPAPPSADPPPVDPDLPEDPGPR